jgi:hypothetical protein
MAIDEYAASDGGSSYDEQVRVKLINSCCSKQQQQQQLQRMRRLHVQ